MIEGRSEKQQLGIPVLAYGTPLETSQVALAQPGESVTVSMEQGK